MSAVDVVIVTYNSRRTLPACLTALLAPGAVARQVFVVDNASSDDSAAWVRAAVPAARLLVNETNRGFAAAVNQAAALGTNPYLLLLNPDACLAPADLARLVDHLARTPRAAAVSPRHTADPAGHWQQSSIPFPPGWPALSRRLPGLRRLRPGQARLEQIWALNRAAWRGRAALAVPWLSGACLLLRRAAFAAAGGLDEGYFLFFEDNELSHALRQAGHELHLLPTARVQHQRGASAAQDPAATRAHLAASGQRFLRRHGDWPTRLLWRLLAGRPPRRTLAPAVAPPPPFSLATGAPVWLELSLEPAFVHPWAAELSAERQALSSQLPLAPDQAFYWRTAPIDDAGALGRYGPEQKCTH